MKIRGRRPRKEVRAVRGAQVLKEEEWNKVLSQFNSFERDRKWIEDRRQELMRQYSNQYIAVNNCQIIAFNPDARALIENLRKVNIDLTQTLIEFMPEEGLLFIY